MKGFNLLFAARDVVQKYHEFSPFELVFGRTARGPSNLLKEKGLTETSDLNLLNYISNITERFYNVSKLAQNNLESSQVQMKLWYDKDARNEF